MPASVYLTHAIAQKAPHTEMLGIRMCTGLLKLAGLEDLNMSSMPADLAATEREGAWGTGRGADRAGAPGLAAYPEA